MYLYVCKCERFSLPLDGTDKINIKRLNLVGLTVSVVRIGYFKSPKDRN